MAQTAAERTSGSLSPRASPRDRVALGSLISPRIRAAQNRARLEDRGVQDGEITPACAQACPSEAIVFGDLHDRGSRVAALARDPRGYHVLPALNTKPAITYLAKVTA